MGFNFNKVNLKKGRKMTISIIIPCFNEEESIQKCEEHIGIGEDQHSSKREKEGVKITYVNLNKLNVSFNPKITNQIVNQCR